MDSGRDRSRGQDPAPRRRRAGRPRGLRHEDPDGVRRPRLQPARVRRGDEAHHEPRRRISIVLLSAHQSIGVPQPLKLFGTKEQKKKYLPRLARGEISAFALTEAHVGSDPANLATTAMRTPEGDYILDGEKLWCTNGTVAGLFVVMARHPDTKKISAFIVEKSLAGRRGRDPLPLHGLEGDRERRHPLHEGAGAEGEPPLGRGQGIEARAHHAQHGTPDAAGLLRGHGETMRRDLPGMGQRTRAVGSAGRPSRRDRAAAGRDGGHDVRHGCGHGPRLVDGRHGRPRHPPRGGRGQDVELGRGLEDHRPDDADPRRARLRDRGFAARPRRGARSPSSA